MKETWKKIDEKYEVSSIGRVRIIGGKILSQRPLPTGYLRVLLHRKDWYVHRLVAEFFIGSAAGKEVNHIDGKKHHNYVGNLEYVSHADNLRHAHFLGKFNRRMTIGLVRRIRFLISSGKKVEQISKFLGVSRFQVSDIKNGRAWAWLK